MRKLILLDIICGFLFFSCENQKGNSPEIVTVQKRNLDSIHIADSLAFLPYYLSNKNKPAIIHQTNNSSKDTIFRFGNLLIDAPKGSGFNFYVYKNDKPPTIPMGDTLYADKKEILFGNNSSSHFVYKKLNRNYRFSDFKLNSFYTGKVHPFSAELHTYTSQYIVTEKDREFLNHGINFAGHYTVFTQDCGCMCQTILIVDLITGKQYYDFPFGKIDGNYGLSFRKNSRLLIANSALIEDQPGYRQIFFNMKPEFYVWNDSTFTRLK